MHLIERYASAARVKISQPEIIEKFYPIAFEKYIVLNAGGAMTAKVFPFYAEVLELLNPILNKYNIKVIQLGNKEEEQFPNVLRLNGLTSIHQSAYIVKRSLLVIANDSFIVHCADSFNKKIVVTFSVSPPTICGPFFGDKSNHRLIEPEFEDKKTYSFNPNENPSPVISIKPERIARAALELLGLKEEINCKSIWFGKDYKKQLVEIIPDHLIHPQQLKDAVLHIRADLLFREDGIYGNAANRPSVIVTDQPLKLDILKQFKQNVKNIIYLLYIKNKERDLKFVKELHDSGITYTLLSHEQENLPLFKFDYLDFNMVHYCPLNKKEEIKNYQKIGAATYFKSNKLILSNGKVFLSKAHWRAGIEFNPKQPSKIIDNEEFYECSDYFYLYNQ